VSTSVGMIDHLQDPVAVLHRPDTLVSEQNQNKTKKKKKKKRTLVRHSCHGGFGWCSYTLRRPSRASRSVFPSTQHAPGRKTEALGRSREKRRTRGTVSRDAKGAIGSPPVCLAHAS
jgi:hypothetical protein